MPGVARHCNTAPRKGRKRGGREGARVLGVTMRAQNGGTHLRVPRAKRTTCERERGERTGGGGRRRERDEKSAAGRREKKRDDDEINATRHALRYYLVIFFFFTSCTYMCIHERRFSIRDMVERSSVDIRFGRIHAAVVRVYISNLALN